MMSAQTLYCPCCGMSYDPRKQGTASCGCSQNVGFERIRRECLMRDRAIKEHVRAFQDGEHQRSQGTPQPSEKQPKPDGALCLVVFCVGTLVVMAIAIGVFLVVAK